VTRDNDAWVPVVETWLEGAPSYEDPDSLLDRIIAEVDETGQHRSLLAAWIGVDGNLIAGFGLGAAATIVTALIGVQLISGPGVGGPAPSSGSASVTPSPTPEPTIAPYGTPDVTSVPPICPPRGGSSSSEFSKEVPDPSDLGLIGLPPEGAVPSSPEVGRLVDCWPVDGGGPPYTGMVRMYADGRLIWNYYLDGGTSGHVEQRLTAEGVELLLGHDNIADKDPLRLAAWLPTSAWLDQTMRPYVPSGYGACLFVDGDHNTGPQATLIEKLAMLPRDVAVLLRDRAPVPTTDYGGTSHCLGLDAEAARQLDAELRRSGFEQDQGRNRYLLEYHLDVDGRGSGTRLIEIWFEPRFPDGSIGCSSCG
jgi:hypothetical protein